MASLQKRSLIDNSKKHIEAPLDLTKNNLLYVKRQIDLINDDKLEECIISENVYTYLNI